VATVEVVDADGSHLRRLTQGSTVVDPSWSPDGRWIVFARYSGIYVIPAGGGAARLVTQAEVPSSPVWSPSGRQIAYRSGTLANGGVLSLVRPDGTHRDRVRDDLSGDRIDWSPDGRRIAFVRTVSGPDPDGVPELDAVRPDNRGRIVLAPQMDDPSWSPDGKVIAASDSTSLWLIGHGVHRLLAEIGTQPAWQPLLESRQ
jgi:Tol biopolymer transport system component